MIERLKWWSESQGQWHYVFGYTIVLVEHNWPIFLMLLVFVVQAYRLYRRPTRPNVGLLYGLLLLGAAYEYRKHVAGNLHIAVDQLLHSEIDYLNGIAHAIVGWIMTDLLIGGGVACIGYSLWLSRAGSRTVSARGADRDLGRRPAGTEEKPAR